MIVLVTGATAGFGECITRRFIQQGHKVIATGRRQERLQELKDELGDNLYIAQLDVRNRAAIEEMLASLPAEWCNIDILVNNAGLALGMEPAHKARFVRSVAATSTKFPWPRCAMAVLSVRPLSARWRVGRRA